MTLATLTSIYLAVSYAVVGVFAAWYFLDAAPYEEIREEVPVGTPRVVVDAAVIFLFLAAPAFLPWWVAKVAAAMHRRKG